MLQSVPVLTLCFLAGFVGCSLRIAIVGGGISGTSTAYFLNEILGARVDVTLFEGSKIGGRLSTISVEGCEYETGGAVIHEKNKYATDLAVKMGLTKMRDDSSSSEVLGLYANNEIIFVSSKFSWFNNIKFLWRYGFDVVRLQQFTDNMLKSFDNVYDVQDKNNSYECLDGLMSAIDPVFLKYMDVSTFDGFKEDGFSSEIINELIQGTLKVNYGQTTSVHRFVGSVSIAGAGATLFSLEGGNKLLPQKLLAASKAKLINSFVKEIGQRGKEFTVKTEFNGTSSESQFDYVIISTPLTVDPARKNKIQFTGHLADIAVPGNYWTTVCTIVKGDINPHFFGYKSAQDVPDLVISVTDSFFNSISTINPVKSGQSCGTVWKVFSRKRLTDVEINTLFQSVKFVQHIDWLAYPHYDVKQHSYNFTLSDGLYYTNALEWAASAIEMDIIGARNVALLLKKKIENYGNISVDEARFSTSSIAHDEV
uniref:Prenylcysteine oxidase n=1 Tax=Lygus hesperus TaxID=30085 RepID=A0A0A9WJS4_LYGHE